MFLESTKKSNGLHLLGKKTNPFQIRSAFRSGFAAARSHFSSEKQTDRQRTRALFFLIFFFLLVFVWRAPRLHMELLRRFTHAIRNRHCPSQPHSRTRKQKGCWEGQELYTKRKINREEREGEISRVGVESFIPLINPEVSGFMGQIWPGEKKKKQQKNIATTKNRQNKILHS